MKTLLSATAVTRLENGTLILATTHDGLFAQHNGKWKRLSLDCNKRIRDLHNNGNFIYGVGDEGVFIRSMNGGLDWTVQRFPTKATSWNVCSDSNGLVIAHGDKMLYISNNFGTTWKTVRPFHLYGYKAPSIRSLCLYKHFLFIGTKIHPKYGGIWLLNLLDGNIKRIHSKNGYMISAMTIYNSYIVAASGSCRGKSGTVEFCSIDEIFKHNNTKWHICHSDRKENSYLDLSVDEQVLYTTSSQNEAGLSTVCRVFLKEGKMTACGSIKGHGWRISNKNEQYVVAGSMESKMTQ